MSSNSSLEDKHTVDVGQKPQQARSATIPVDPEIEKLKDLPVLYLRETVTVTPLKKIPDNLKRTYIKFKDKRKNPIPAVKVPMAAAGPAIAVPVSNLVEVSDPISPDNRKKLTDAAKMDTIIKPALRRRKTGFFANGYKIKLVLKSARDKTGRLLNDQEQIVLLQQYEQTYQAVLKKIEDWDKLPLIKTREKMKIGFHAGLVQGHFLIKIYPGFDKLDWQKGEMPLTLKHVASEDIKGIIVDRQTNMIVGIRVTSFEAQKDIIVTPAEMIYVPMNDSGLTMEEAFYGNPEIDHLLQISRINRRALNYDYAKALVTAYQPKTVGTMPVDGSPEEKDAQLKKRAQDIASDGTDVIILEASPDTKIESVGITVNHDMMSKIRDDSDQQLMTGCGVTKLQMGRTDNLNRDNATIMEIENTRNVRTPDEEHVSGYFVMQLYNRLLAHLTRTPFSKLPVQFEIERIEPKDETAAVQKPKEPTLKTPGQDQGLQDKASQLDSEQIAQPDADTGLGS